MPWKNTYFYLLYLPLLESFSVKSNVKADCGRTCKYVNVSKLEIRKSKKFFFYFAKKKWRLLSHPEKNNPSFLETQLCALFCPGLFALSLSLSPCLCLPFSLSALHEVLVVIYLDMKEGKPQGNTWQGFLSMILGSSLHSLAVTVGEYKGVIKDCCHVTVKNTVWNQDVPHQCRLWATKMCFVCCD